MSRPVIIRKGSSNVVEGIDSESEKTITRFGTQYHFLNDIKHNIVINGYITPNPQKVSPYGIDLGIIPTVNTKFELYIHNTGTHMGNGNINLGLFVKSGSAYGDNADFRFFWADVPGIYFDMYNSRNNTNNFNNAIYTNRIMKVECGRNSSTRNAYMNLYRYSDDYLIYSGTSYCSAPDNFSWSRGTLLLEQYHSNNFYMSWYLIRIYEGEQLIMELYPAQKPGYGWCFMDNVSGNYFYNQDSSPWIYTESSEHIILEKR